METMLLENSVPKRSSDRLLQRLNAAQVALINDRLNNRSINISKLAREVGLSRAMFYYIVRGQSSTNPENLRRIAIGLKIDPKIIVD